MNANTTANVRAGQLWRNAPLLLLALGLAAWACYEGQRLIRADALAMGTSKQVSSWASGATLPASQLEWDQARANLLGALEITPDNAALHGDLGDLHAVAARRDWADEPARVQHLRAALAQYRLLLALRPSDPQTWANVASCYQGMGENGEAMHQAWAKALALGPHEGYVQPTLLEITLATWATATLAMQDWAKDFYAGSAAPQRKAINEMADRYGLHFDAEPTAAAGYQTGELPPK